MTETQTTTETGDKTMDDNDAIDILGYAISDGCRYHRNQLTGEFTIDDVRKTIKTLLAELMVREPTDADADAVLAY